MADETVATDAHVVVASGPLAEDSVIGSALYAVVADTPGQAIAAVLHIAPPEATVVATGRPLKPETAERLALVPGEVKQIG